MLRILILLFKIMSYVEKSFSTAGIINGLVSSFILSNMPFLIFSSLHFGYYSDLASIDKENSNLC